MSSKPQRNVRVATVWLGAVTLLAGILRFPTLGVQSFWDDEGYTVELIRMSLHSMITAVPKSESTPPPYYVIAWLWSRLFGEGEWGLRSVSALFGTLLVPVAYATGSRLQSRKAGLLAALLVSTNPLLIWYSQEARVYALLTLLGGLSFLTFVMACQDQSVSSVAWWCLACIVALCTHYFALFLVAPEALLLLYRKRDRSTIASVGLLTTVGLALLPLALVQRNRGYVFHNVALSTRILQVPEQFLVGYGVWYTTLGKLAAAVAAAVWGYGLLAMLRRGSRTALAGLAVTFTAFLLPVMLAGVGLDYVHALYFVALAMPTIALLSTGLSKTRVGAAMAATVAVIGLAVFAVVETHAQFQREDLRGVASSIDRDSLPKAIVITPPSVLEAYIPTLRPLGSNRLVREVVVVAMSQKAPGEPPRVPRSFSRQFSIPGFKLVEVLDANRFTLVRFRANRPQAVTVQRLERNRIRGGAITRTVVLFEP